MLENVIRLVSQVDENVSHWYISNGTPIEVAEKMCLQFLQVLGKIKAQNEAMAQAQKDAADQAALESANKAAIEEPPKQE